MYGLIGEIQTTPEGRGTVVQALLTCAYGMPGNIHYLVAEDASNATAVWVTEVWHSQEAHDASLQLPEVQAAIAAARDHITGFGQRVETIPHQPTQA